MPSIRNYVQDAIQHDPLVLSRSVEAQVPSLVVDPLRRAMLDGKHARSLRSGPKLIIIDGLDECGTTSVQRYILTVLATAIQQLPLPISILISSRPEQIIQGAFSIEPLASITRCLALDSSYHPDEDIKLFLQSKFDKIKQNHPLRDLLPPEWPSKSELLRLVQKSSGQFIYASTVMKYLESLHHLPTDALDIIFGQSNSGFDTPFAELDALYIRLFSRVKNINKVLEILSLLLATRIQDRRWRTPKGIETLLLLRPGEVYTALSDLHSILDVPPPANSSTSQIHSFHASLGDFFSDKSRSAKFRIDTGNAHAKMTQHLLKQISMHFCCGTFF